MIFAGHRRRQNVDAKRTKTQFEREYEFQPSIAEPTNKVEKSEHKKI